MRGTDGCCAAASPHSVEPCAVGDLARGCRESVDLVYAVVAPVSTWEPMGWFGTYEPSSLRLEASTICQLACPSCATTHGTIKAQIGAGFLKFDDFRRLVDENPWVWEIELSNWGEIS